MIPRETVHKIERLLASTDLTHQQIAKQTGVCRPTVSAIFRGTHRHVGEDPIVPPKGPAVRCPDCGYKSPAPCWECQMQELRRKQYPKER